MLIYLLFDIGATSNGLFFKFIESWQLIIIIYSLAPLFVCIIGVIYYL